jgi:hypothetical protein
MQKYMASDLTHAEDIDIGNACEPRVYLAEEVEARIAELECGIKGCVLPKHHSLLPENHPHRWCSETWIKP